MIKNKILSAAIVAVLVVTPLIGLAQPAPLPDNVGLTPDSPFYFLKSWREQIQLFFTFGAENKAKQLLHLAEVRLAEYQKMVEKGKEEIAARTLDKYKDQLDRAIAKVKEIEDKGADAKEIAKQVEEAATKHVSALQENLLKVPEQAKQGIERALENAKRWFEEHKDDINKAENKEPEGNGIKNEREFTVVAKNYSFVPKTLTVKKGEKVTIKLKNVEGFHDLVIDGYNVATKRLNAHEEDEVKFVADKVGAFKYYCSVGEHRKMGMEGTLTVTE